MSQGLENSWMTGTAQQFSSEIPSSATIIANPNHQIKPTWMQLDLNSFSITHRGAIAAVHMGELEVYTSDRTVYEWCNHAREFFVSRISKIDRFSPAILWMAIRSSFSLVWVLRWGPNHKVFLHVLTYTAITWMHKAVSQLKWFKQRSRQFSLLPKCQIVIRSIGRQPLIWEISN